MEDCESCYSVWKTDLDGSKHVLNQGCWSGALNCIQDDQCVHNPELLPTQISKWSNFSVCCCRDPMCNHNDNMVNNIFTKEETEVVTTPIPTFVLIVGISLVGLILAGVAISLIYARSKKRKQMEKNDDKYDCTAEAGKVCMSFSKEKLLSNYNCSELNGRPPAPLLSLNNFLVDGIISEETVATVVHRLKRRRQSGGESDGPVLVAGKQFKSSQSQRFLNETNIYQILNEFNQGSRFFLRWYGSYKDDEGVGCGGAGDVGGEADVNSTSSCFKRDLLICLELAPLGPLSLFLSANTLDWLQLSQMLVDISRGIALLHNNLNTRDGRHVTVCHRDLNTSNILVRADFSCCISNFSHAIVFEPGQQFSSKTDCKTVILKNESATMMGSVRYLAPELLDSGRVLNLTENSLKQVDVYALALLFWEASRRCHDLYQGVAVPKFELAYEKEMGTVPSLEQMRILVAKNRARPLFPEVWKDSNPAIQMLKETITESWEEEGEARLTVDTVVQRFQIIDTQMQRYKLVSQGPPTVDKSWLNNTQSDQRFKATAAAAPASEVPRLERSFNNQAITNNRKTDNIFSGQRPTIRIQPHQGTY